MGQTFGLYFRGSNLDEAKEARYRFTQEAQNLPTQATLDDLPSGNIDAVITSVVLELGDRLAQMGAVDTELWSILPHLIQIKMDLAERDLDNALNTDSSPNPILTHPAEIELCKLLWKEHALHLARGWRKQYLKYRNLLRAVQTTGIDQARTIILDLNRQDESFCI
jgi:hypothetical protein